MRSWIVISASVLVAGLAVAVRGAEVPDYRRDVMPILTRYCAGCHNDEDREGNLSVLSLKAMVEGGDSGPALIAGQGDRSRLIQVLTGEAEPAMPPEDEEQLSAEEISVLRRWIDAGPKDSPRGTAATAENALPELGFPKLRPSPTAKPITAVAYSLDGKLLAVARFREVELLTAADQRFIRRFDQHPGKVNDIRFSRDGRYLFVASGLVGTSGEALIWDLESGRLHARLGEHSDVLYAAVPSQDGKWLATAGYDRQIIVWELATQKPRHRLRGHNGPIYDLAFTPDSRILASASADATVKVWDVETGTRLDTLSQPLQEQHTVDISPDGRFIVAGGEDNRIRMWQLISVDRPRINPLLIARFGHEQTVECVRYTAEGDYIVSVAADRKLKVWDATTLTQLQTTDIGDDVAQALAVESRSQRVAIGRMDGALLVEKITPRVLSLAKTPETPPVAAANSQTSTDGTDRIEEHEPNDGSSTAQSITVPAEVVGRIYHGSEQSDVDYFRFVAQRGEEFILETRAARDKSPLDSKISVRTIDDQSIPRVLLRAVRDSYFTFRGKNSTQTGDFRLHNWREMRLNQLLYASGEVVKLYHYPRGPDSGFNVYPNFGNRHTYFDTTSVTHALHEPCYIVQPLPPGTVAPPNGLPTFVIDYENDDESQQRYGSDSYLAFQPPEDGEYLVRVEDVRGFQGEDFTYELTIRHPKPDFEVEIHGRDPSVPRGAGRKFELRIVRLDGFDGEVRVDIDNLPPGMKVTSPITIESGHLRAWGTITAAAGIEAFSDEVAKQSTVTATTMIGGRHVRKQFGSLGKIKLEDEPKLLVDFSKDGRRGGDLPVIEIQAGTTTTALIRIDRRGHAGRVGFGSEEAVFNAPHGVYVNNIGLNGVLITENQNERSIFITAEPWVAACERLVFVEAGDAGRPTSQPVLLRVLPRDSQLSIRD